MRSAQRSSFVSVRAPTYPVTSSTTLALPLPARTSSQCIAATAWRRPGQRVLPVGAMAFVPSRRGIPTEDSPPKALPASGTVLLSARKDGWSALGPRIDTVAEVGSSDVRLVMRPTCRVRVQVVDAGDGTAVDLYSLSYRLPPGCESWPKRHGAPWRMEPPGIRTAESSEVRLYLGRFAPKPTDHGDGELTLRFGAPGYEDLALPVTVRAGQLVEARAELRRTSGPRARVRFRAQVNGRPYSGDQSIG